MIEYGHRANFFQSYSKNISPDCVQNSLMISKITHRILFCFLNKKKRKM